MQNIMYFLYHKRYMYIVDNFLSQVMFIFLLFQLHQHTLPYPQTKEEQKLPEVKINFNIYRYYLIRCLKLSYLTFFMCINGRLRRVWRSGYQTLDLEVWDSSLACRIVSLDKELYSTLSLFTQVDKWVWVTYCWGVTLRWTNILS